MSWELDLAGWAGGGFINDTGYIRSHSLGRHPRCCLEMSSWSVLVGVYARTEVAQH